MDLKVFVLWLALVVTAPQKCRTGARSRGRRERTSQALSDSLFDLGDEEMAKLVREMFYHGYDNYKRHAFPHDELKPISRSYTDSLGELGNLNLEHLSDSYQGVAMTLIDSLSTLAVLGDAAEFASSVEWLHANLTFDQDVRVNVFECNIRILGGLLSAHLLASDASLGLAPHYKGELLALAQDIGDRLMPAFSESPTGLPYAWVNLRHGVREDETTETNTAACGSLILEMGMLSRLTDEPEYEDAAREAVRALWDMRSENDLLGTTLDMADATWLSTSGGIGASADSFYEYMLKAYILFGDDEFYWIFEKAYTAAMQSYKSGPWYHETDIHTRKPTHKQFTALQAFWPGLQVLVGDLGIAQETFDTFFSVWLMFGVLPERFLWDTMSLHSTEQYYPLRPELVESAFQLFASTRDQRYQVAGKHIYQSLQEYTKVEGGHASIRSVRTKEKEDVMHSFFLAETCKYLYLLYNDTMLRGRNYVFTTEGHLFPVGAPAAFSRSITTEDGSGAEGDEEQQCDGEGMMVWEQQLWGMRRGWSALDAMVCPHADPGISMVDSTCHVLDVKMDHSCEGDHECGVDSTTCKPRVCTENICAAPGALDDGRR